MFSPAVIQEERGRSTRRWFGKSPLWETVDPDEPPLTPKEEEAMDRAHKNFMRGEYVSLDELDDFLAAEALVNVDSHI